MTSPHKRKAGKQGLRGRGNRVPKQTYDGILLNGAADPAGMVDKASRRIAAAAQTRRHQEELEAAIAAGANVTPIGTGRPTLRYEKVEPVVETPKQEPVVCTQEHVKPGHVQVLLEWGLKDARSLLEQGYRPEWVAWRTRSDLEAVHAIMQGMEYRQTPDQVEIAEKGPVLVNHGTVDGYWWHRSIKKSKICDACRAAYNAAHDLPVPPAPTVYVNPDVDTLCGDAKGTPKGYGRHKAKKKKACEECRVAWNAYCADRERIKKIEAEQSAARVRVEKIEAEQAATTPHPRAGSGHRPVCEKPGLTGTPDGYLKHVKRKQKACDACKAAWQADAERTA